MPTTNPLDILLAHDLWATRQMLQACEKLAPGQFAQKFDIGPGSLQATLTHIIAAMRTWNDTLAQRPLGARIDQGTLYTPAELLGLLEEAGAVLAAQARLRPLSDIVTRTREGKSYPIVRAAIITHVATHGMHHRAQCLNMLRQLGVKPLPPSSVAEWSRSVDFVG